MGNFDVIFHENNDESITICDVSYIADLGFKPFSIHEAQEDEIVFWMQRDHSV